MLSFIISKESLQELIKQNNSNLLIVDIREKEKYERDHIEGAINYDYNLIMKSNYFGEQITKDKRIVLYCDRGGRSIYATRRLRGLGYNVASLLGGIENYMVQ